MLIVYCNRVSFVYIDYLDNYESSHIWSIWLVVYYLRTITGEQFPIE